mmetsp:Transcript_18003/g.58771  ORF Transcript_18003/g.58771 Transcript_18003/m.58771 type:complete len:960 (-) Transcript_18003:2139-5018(-)
MPWVQVAHGKWVRQADETEGEKRKSVLKKADRRGTSAHRIGVLEPEGDAAASGMSRMSLTPVEEGGRRPETKMRQAVFAERQQMVDDPAELSKEKTPEQMTAVLKGMDSIDIFRGLPAEVVRALADAFAVEHFAAGQEVFAAGEEGNKFYMVASGDFCREDGSVMDHSFGEESLLYACERPLTVYTKSPGVLYSLRRDIYQTVVRKAARKAETRMEDLVGSVPLLQQLSLQQRMKTAAALTSRAYTDGEVIISQGDIGDMFYLLARGQVVVRKKDSSGAEKEVAKLGPGAYFGERALLNDEPRAATVIALGSDVECACLDRKSFDSVLGPLQELLVQSIRMGSLRAVPLLSGLTNAEREKVVKEMSVERFKEGEKIISQGEQGDKFYLIEDGQVEVSVVSTEGAHKVVGTLEQGDFFGERALLNSEQRGATVTALAETRCGVLNRDTFTKYIGPLQDILDASQERQLMIHLEMLRDVPMLAILTDSELKGLATDLTTRSYSAGDAIIKQDDVGDTFYIVYEGEVVVSTIRANGAEEEIAKLMVGSFFGEQAILSDAKRSATVKALSESVTCLEISRTIFLRFLGKRKSIISISDSRMKELQADAVAAVAAAKNAVGKAPDAKPALDGPKWEDLDIFRTLGCGSFGRVRLCRNKHNGTTYALKGLKKRAVEQMKQEKSIMNEKRCLEQLRHPFILRLFATYKDPAKLYMLLELVLGGELFTLNASIGPFKENDAKFFAGCIVLAFEEMQRYGWVYRDLKPENILIDHLGYAKVVDLGFAKQLRDPIDPSSPDGKNRVYDKTYTLCGTPDYLAPEVIACKGHGFPVDWWGLGILIYELMYGQAPFSTEDPMATYQLINKYTKIGKLQYPTGFSKPACDLISKLLHPNPQLRLGVLRGGVADIKTHPWFSGLDWDKLYKQEIKAPWVPEIKDSMDARNFDEYPEDSDEDEEYSGNGQWFADF